MEHFIASPYFSDFAYLKLTEEEWKAIEELKVVLSVTATTLL